MLKFKTEQRAHSVLDDAICDSCQKSTMVILGTTKSYEYATISTDWGYGSIKDTECAEFHICESCYDKVEKFLNIKPQDRS